MATNPHTRLTEAEYVALERAAEIRSEFLDGETFAMAGASIEHSRLQSNLLAELHRRLAALGCEVFGPDLRVRVSGRMHAYPDISVVCGQAALADESHDALLNPVAIFEVLSPSTEGYDRGLKFQRYRTIPSLKEYVLVDQSQVRIEQFTRQSDTVWTLRDYRDSSEELVIETIGVSIPLSRIYARIEFPK